MVDLAPNDTSKANILVVDDRDDKRMAVEIVLADLGQNIIHASSGRSALRELLRQDFAVILLDVNMPGMDGFETAHLIRQRKASENVPIIFISALSDAETHVSRGYSLGAVDYILAPIVPEVLRSKVAVFVELFKITDQVKKQAEDLRLAQMQLEKRVEERTRELAIANKALKAEIQRREETEQDLRNLNNSLENRVATRTQALEAANIELETFTYSIAHDVKAPFRQIRGYAELLKEELFPIINPEAASYLIRIGDKAKEMESMVDDLLKLFSLAKVPFEIETVDLKRIVDEVLSGLKRESSGRSVEWVVKTLPVLKCNYGLMKQVFENLLANALKYTRPRAVARIEIGSLIDANETIIYVEDNGVGFDMSHTERLFGVFQRLHRAEDFEGTGVGLALVAKIIRKHNGRIWAKGEVNKGAKFFFTLGGL